jgi:LmbE family N-acetylglucosaminyl deacetylase
MMAIRQALLACILTALILVLGPGSSLAQGQAGAMVTADTLHPDDGKLRIVQFGAHPDDCEIRAGGVGAMWAELGHHVQFCSVTNGDIGHWQMSGGALAKRRRAEVEAAGEALGIDSSIVLDIHDGELMPSLENRRLLTRVMREWDVDIVIGHRPNDYHPDHRYVGVLMQDAAYMVAVPFFCPDTPPLRGNPVFLYSEDSFQLPTPFRPDVVVAIDSVIEKKAEALSRIESQFVEGGCMGYRRGMPADDAERESRREGVRASFKQRSARTADTYRDKLIELYGEEKGKQVKYAEAFMVCEYGTRPDAEMLKELFPFFP